MAILKDAIRQAHPVYQVRDLERSVRFYRDVLGLEQAWEFEDWAVAFHITPGFLIVLAQEGGEVSPADDRGIVLVVTDIDEAYGELQARGVEFAGPIEQRPYGRIATFRDPDGYTYDLCG
jgi:catechol 2,3-dioxygenase-like lactoylglutathione lyase family enzyme